MKPLVSVYMTVRNGSRWLREAIESIQIQTLQEWELIVVDDGSTDDSLRIAQELASSDKRITVVPTGGVGRATALNTALSLCRTEFVANLDADDLAHPKRLEIQYTLAEKYPEYSLICSDCIIIKESNATQWESLECTTVGLMDITKKLAYYNPVNHSSVFMRRKVLLQVGGYSTKLNMNVDYELWVRLAAAGNKLARINMPLVAKRWHDEQSFENKRHLAYVLSSLRVQAQAIRLLKPGPLAWIFIGGRLFWGLMPRFIRFIRISRRRHTG